MGSLTPATNVRASTAASAAAPDPDPGGTAAGPEAGDSTVVVVPVRPAWLPPVALTIGGVATAGYLTLIVAGASMSAIVGTWADAAHELPWLVGTVVNLGVAIMVWRRIPSNPVAGWAALAGTTGGLTSLLGLGAEIGFHSGVLDVRAVALVYVMWSLAGIVGAVSLAHLLGLFPDGLVRRGVGRRMLQAIWLVPLVPVVMAVATPTVLVPSWSAIPALTNPFMVLGGPIDPATAQVVLDTTQLVILVGGVLLLVRYRREGWELRRRIRWLLLPIVVAATSVATGLLLPDADVVAIVVSLLSYLSFTAAVGFALLQPHGVDVDRVLRRTLVYGVLWTTITGVYVAAGSAVGVAAGNRLSIGWAVTLTVVATLAFQPARSWLQGLADRWMFGTRSDPTHVIARLGNTLAETYDLETLLPRMAATLRSGLGLEWARVTLAHDDPGSGANHDRPDCAGGGLGDAALVVPIVLDGEVLGTVECGPRTVGQLSKQDEAVVATLAQQAALAVRNVGLTEELARQADRLAASRTRLVRAQEVERRRIERNIHDGVQQELVALISQAGRVQVLADGDPNAVARELAALRQGLGHVLRDLRSWLRGFIPAC